MWAPAGGWEKGFKGPARPVGDEGLVPKSPSTTTTTTKAAIRLPFSRVAGHRLSHWGRDWDVEVRKFVGSRGDTGAWGWGPLGSGEGRREPELFIVCIRI